jgi:preprotein translocase subunit SecD
MTVRTKFVLIMLLTLVAGLIAYPREDQILRFLGIKQNLQVRQGLDLRGGAQLVYQADLSKIPSADKTNAMDSLVNVMQKRANPAGTSEVVVQQTGSDRVIVELPDEKDLAKAIDTIGKTADLQFVEVQGEQQSPTGISGKDVDRADIDFDQNGRPVVSLQLKTGESTKRFGEVTTRISGSGSQLVTLLDDQIVFGPATVQNAITDGRAQLQGTFTIDQAKQIAELINAGALPAPVSLVEQRTVGATLGKDSIQRSILAGLIGLGIVALFMVAYYRLAGLLAVGALGVYTILTLAIYKLSALTPFSIVLTLAGVAGFILSIGMAVDANILIFERTKEEMRDGKSLLSAVEAGFDRAWTSIRDSNISTIITCIILYNFSGSIPIIKGFAVTLLLGVLISLFTAIVVSRTFLRLFIQSRWGGRPELYGFTQEGTK